MLIVDLDGTLFSNLHREHLLPAPADMGSAESWHDFNRACQDDTPISPVIGLVQYLADHHHGKITFLTSRGDAAREETQRQLARHFRANEYRYELIMRPMSDSRSATDYKRDVLQELAPDFGLMSVIIEDNLNVLSMVEKEFPALGRLAVPSHDCSYAGVISAQRTDYR